MYDDDEAARIIGALGPTWSTLRAVVDRWFADNREQLASRWSFPIGDQELLNHELGVFLHDPNDDHRVAFDYDATPRDSYAFASTGVDGEHYSVLLDERSKGVVVVTAPMAFERPHVVVGSSLLEVLALVSGGCGLAVPPNLAYRPWDQTVEALDQPTDNALWRHLRLELGLAPWPDPAARLAQLRDEYLGSVRPRRS